MPQGLVVFENMKLKLTSERRGQFDPFRFTRQSHSKGRNRLATASRLVHGSYKPEVVSHDFAGDYLLRESGMTLLARQS